MATMLEETPARFVQRTPYHIRPSGSDFLVQTDYSVYPSRRVGVSLTIQNLSGASRTLSTVEYAIVNVEDALAWNTSTLSSNHALGFSRTSGQTPWPSSLSESCHCATG
jgi:hypothetical protein